MKFNLIYCIYRATFLGHKLDWFKTVLSIQYHVLSSGCCHGLSKQSQVLLLCSTLNKQLMDIGELSSNVPTQHIYAQRYILFTYRPIPTRENMGLKNTNLYKTLQLENFIFLSELTYIALLLLFIFQVSSSFLLSIVPIHISVIHGHLFMGLQEK